MGQITKIIDTQRIQLSEPWNYERTTGNIIRIAGLFPMRRGPSSDQELIRLRQILLGKSVTIKLPYYVERGNILVADIEIAGIGLHDFFSNRIYEPKPKIRAMELGDHRQIEKVKATVSKKWINPFRGIPPDVKPDFNNAEFPDDLGNPIYRKEIEHIRHIYCEDRVDAQVDIDSINNFLTSFYKKVYVLFGSCGSGKSWFVRWILLNANPDLYDVGIIDVSEIFDQNEDNFQKRLQIKLSKILSDYVNTQEGGLKKQLKFHFEKEARGIYPTAGYDEPAVIDWIEDCLKELEKPENIINYNMLRLESYAYSDKKFVLLIDNADKYVSHDSKRLFEMIVRIGSGYKNVLLIIPFRPSSDFYAARLNTFLQQLIDTHNISLLDEYKVLKKRFSVSITGLSIENYAITDPYYSVSYPYKVLFAKFRESPAAKIINNLSRGDIRQYLRLFKRHIYSHLLKNLNYIGKDYFCVGNLMLKPGETRASDISYIYNVFDNDHKDEIQNTMIRWRVLEYFLNGNSKLEGDYFEYYFNRLGFDLKRVNEVISLWIETGALERSIYSADAEATECGHAYKDLIRNLWYCIAIKSSMHIDIRYIQRGEQAQKSAKKDRYRLPTDSEWISSEDFIKFIIDEEQLEKKRIESFPSKVPAFEAACAALGPAELSTYLWYEYSNQKIKWFIKRGIL